MTKQVFYDPQRKRWKRLRRIFDVARPVRHRRRRALHHRPAAHDDTARASARHAQAQLQPAHGRAPASPRRPRPKRVVGCVARPACKPSEIVLNSGEGLRAAYYVEDDPASYSSLKQHIKQIDLLFPEWLHVVTPDGALTSYSLDNRAFAVVDQRRRASGGPRESRRPDHRGGRGETPEIFPLVNNYDPVKNIFLAFDRRLPRQPRRARALRPADRPVPRRQPQLPRHLARLRGDSRRGAARLHGAARRALHATSIRATSSSTSTRRSATTTST